MNTDEMLIATTARTMTFHAGQHAKQVPAGTLVMVHADAIDSGLAYARVVSNPRISEVVYVSALIPA